ncbi:MAG: patatin-like phospholipase family protein [Caldilineaceae bacterium]|nr:patatin-like phospholipase family protein [Caldilineaceae bacterium]
MNSVLITVVALFVLIILLLRIQRSRPLLQYLFFIRHSLLVGLILVGLAPVALYLLPNMGQNLFVIDTIWGIGLVTALAVIASWVVMFTMLLTIRSAPRVMLDIYRPVHAPRWLPKWVIRQRAWFFALLTLPILIAVYVHSDHVDQSWVTRIATVPPWVQNAGYGAQWMQAVQAAPAWSRAVGLAVGIAPAWLLLRVAILLRSWLSPSLDRIRAALASWLRPLLGPLPVSIQNAYSDQNVRSFRHDEAAGFFILTLVIYFLGFIFLRPDAPRFSVPALSYFLLMLILLGWLLPGLSLILDRWRVPTLFVLLALSYIFWGVANLSGYPTGHVYNVVDPPTDALRRPTQPLTPERVYQLWSQRHPVAQYPVMTVVTVSGGGISSATWSSQVLTGLQKQLGASFSDSILFFSTVSGGSVGVLNFVDAYRQGQPPADDLDAIVTQASTESLSPTIWGIVYPDLWRFFLSNPVIWNPTHDRGWALEQAWANRLHHPDATLLDWGRDVEDGLRPLVLFNSSIVETGERMLLTPAQAESNQQSARWPTRYFLDMYAGRDLPVTTAARLSATFPYVSPIARPAFDGTPIEPNGFRLADGGYFDNHGTVTAIEWLQQILPLAKAEKRTKILVLEIRLYDFLPRTPPENEFQPNWTNTFIGPLSTLLGTWGTTQVQRATVEWSLLQEAHPDVQIQKVAFFPRPKPRCTVEDDPACGEELLDPATVPLSWQLSPGQIEFLQESWRERSTAERQKVAACLQRGACGLMQSIFQAE